MNRGKLNIFCLRRLNINIHFKKQWAVVLFIIFVLGFSVRLVYLSQVSKTAFFLPLTLDPEAYEKKASEILADKKFHPEGIFYQTPLYPYFLVFSHKIFGKNLFLIRLLQIFIGSLIPVLVYFIAKQFFLISTSLLASFITAFYGPLLYESALGDKTTLAVFFFTLAVLITIKAHQNQKNWLLAGIIWGISALLRENSLFVGVVISFTYGGKKFWQCLLGILLPILPITLLNLRTGDFVLITSQGGQNFYVGNSSYSTGSYIAPPFVRATPEFEQSDFKREAESRLEKSLKPSSASSYWFKEGLKFLFKNPQKALSLYTKKILLLVNAYEIPDNYNYEFLKKYISILKLPFFDFGLIGSFAIIGFFYAWKKKRKQKISIMYTVIFLYAFTLILFYIVGRYRILLIPLFIPFSSFAITYIYDNFIEKKWKVLILTIFLLVFSLFLVNHRQDDYPISKDFSKEHYVLGHAYRKAGMLAHAIREWEKALEENPDFKKAMNDLVFAKAILKSDSLKQILISDSLNAKVHLEYGILLLDLQKDSMALESFKRVIEINPNFADAWAKLGLFYGARKGDFKKAKEFLKKAVRLDSSNANYWVNLGNCHFELGEKKEALFCWEKSLSLKQGNGIIIENIKILQKEINIGKEHLQKH